MIICNSCVFIIMIIIIIIMMVIIIIVISDMTWQVKKQTVIKNVVLPNMFLAYHQKSAVLQSMHFFASISPYDATITDKIV